MADGKIKVTLSKSPIGRLESHKACLTGLGLRKIRQTVEVEDTPAVRGMINKVSYMVSVEEPSAGREPSAAVDKEPSAGKEPSAEKEPSAAPSKE